MGGEKFEEFSINGDELVAKVRQLVHEGNVRRLTIKRERRHADRDPAHDRGNRGGAAACIRGDRRLGGAGHALRDRGGASGARRRRRRTSGLRGVDAYAAQISCREDGSRKGL